LHPKQPLTATAPAPFIRHLLQNHTYALPSQSSRDTEAKKIMRIEVLTPIR